MKFSDKLKLIRKINNLTQADFADSIGISRSNLANIELGNVEPTEMFKTCVSLRYGINKDVLMDDSNDDLGALKGSSNITSQIASKYELLDDKYKKFVENQINQLLEIQNEDK